jgi:cobalamin synthase
MGGFCFMFFLQVPVEEQGEQRMSNFDCTAMATVVGLVVGSFVGTVYSYSFSVKFPPFNMGVQLR